MTVTPTQAASAPAEAVGEGRTSAPPANLRADASGARTAPGEVQRTAPRGEVARALLSRLWRDHLFEHRLGLALCLVAIAGVAGSVALYPLLINWAVDAFAAREAWAVTTLPWLALAAAIGRAGALYAQVVLTQRVVTRVEADLQKRLYRHLVRADLAQLSREAPAAWTQRFTTDLIYIREAITRTIQLLVRDGLTILALVGTMFYLDWVLALIACVILPLALIPITLIGRRLRTVSRTTQEKTGAMASLTAETFGTARMVKAYRLEDYLTRRADDVFDRLRALRLNAQLGRGRVAPFTEILGGIAVTAILIVIGWRVLSGESTIGEFSGFLGALIIAAQPLRGLGTLNATVQEGLAALERTYRLLDEAPRVTEAPHARPATFGADAVTFEAVSFAYTATAPALHAVSFCAPAGATTAIVGPSGAGKSTIFNLVPRLYDPTAGRINIGGEAIDGLTLDSLRARIAVVSQEVSIFNDTIAANIRLGRQDADDAMIREAAVSAGAHDFITAHPMGYDAPMGERGENFSGGERQRIALARAFLKDAPILLLDEATSALDAKTEGLVREALARLSKGRTTLVIAHRLATVRAAERIVVMDAGRVAEIGTHEELVAAGALYARLHALQLSD